MQKISGISRKSIILGRFWESAMKEIFLFEPREEKFKKPFGAIKCGEKVFFFVYALSSEVKTVKAVFYCEYKREELTVTLDWVSKEREYDILEVCIDKFTSPDIIWYYFEIETFDGKKFYYGKNRIIEKNFDIPKFQITVYSAEYRTPEWFSEGVTYHIFVDRFFRGKDSPKLENDEYFYLHRDTKDTPLFLPNEKGIVENRDIYGGDFAGIIEKLPYIESLSVKTIYLSPVFEAWSNHKYNTADYKKIDESFGNEGKLKELCNEAAKRGIRVILDGVFSHTGSDSIYFNREGRYGENTGAYRDKNSLYREWYDIDENNNYASWWGIDTLPQVNELNESYLQFITGEKFSVISHWMNLGVSGWRLDVADELPDEFISKLKERARCENSQALVIGEVWEDASTKKAYGRNKKYFTEGVLDGVMNYPLKNAILDFLGSRIDAKGFSDAIETLLENYPSESLRGLMNILGTHDTVRVINELSVGSLCHTSKEYRSSYVLSEGEKEIGKRRLYLAAVLQYMFPGSPCIYYGDEIGMEGFEDPFNRRFFTWDDMDVTVLQFYRNLGKIKASERPLHGNTVLEVRYAARDVIVLARGELVAIVNRGVKSKIFKFKKEFDILISGGKVIKRSKKVLLHPVSVCILKFI